jgi:hypothetical protein
MNSTSVSTPERRHSLAKKKTVRMPDITELHQTQLPAMPCCATKPVTASGVSTANVVATIEMPASHHGTLRPLRKNSLKLEPPRLANASPMARLTAKNPATTAQSNPLSAIAPRSAASVGTSPGCRKGIQTKEGARPLVRYVAKSSLDWHGRARMGTFYRVGG